MKKKKILFISQYFYPENFKGNDVVFELQKRGYKIIVITAKPNYPGGNFYDGYGLLKRNFELINEVQVFRLPIIARGNGGSFRLVLNYFSFYFSSWVFFILKKKKLDFDMIITQQLSPITSSLPALWYKNLKNTPLITWTLDLWPESVIATTSIKKGLLISWLERLAIRLYDSSDFILVSSKSFIESINSRISNIRKITYFPNWADEIFEKNNDSIKFPKLPNGFNVVFAGNLGEAQDLPNILKCINLLKEHKDINFIFVGSGRFEQQLKIETENLNNVFMFPQHQVDYMPSLYKQSSLMLLSLKGGEYISNTVPAKLQTYMSCGKPILAMIDGEANDLIKESNCGLAAKAGDYCTLASYILQLYKLPKSELDRIGLNGQEYYKKNFSRKLALEKIEKIINTLDF